MGLEEILISVILNILSLRCLWDIYMGMIRRFSILELDGGYYSCIYLYIYIYSFELKELGFYWLLLFINCYNFLVILWVVFKDVLEVMVGVFYILIIVFMLEMDKVLLF